MHLYNKNTGTIWVKCLIDTIKGTELINPIPFVCILRLCTRVKSVMPLFVKKLNSAFQPLAEIIRRLAVCFTFCRTVAKLVSD